jgi:signal transduction histidine kinase/CheY-like chemotaxis protein
MLAAEAGDRRLATDPSRAALEFAHALLTGTGPTGGLDEVVHELARALNATAAGLGAYPGGADRVRHVRDAAAFVAPPWETCPDVLSKVQQSTSGVVIPGDGAPFLVAAVGPPVEAGWFLWVVDRARPMWSAAESAALSIIASVMASAGAGDASTRWARQFERSVRQQNLERAAVLTRRLAHDFGNVLTGLLGFSELALAQNVTPGSALHRHIVEIYRSAQGGATLTNQLRLFSRRQASSARSGNIAAALHDEAGRLGQMPEDNVRLQTTVPPELRPVALDQDHLRQVLAALIDNAREAAGGRGIVEASAEVVQLADVDCLDYFGTLRAGTHVEVCISDNGPGLSAEAAERLFVEPFYTSKARRRGFGLMVAYGLLSAHHGGLRLDPKFQGTGVTARVVIPVSRALAPAAAVVPSSALTAPPHAQGERILVVDDDPFVLKFVSTTLEQAGYRVEAVASGADALASHSTAEEPFALVLSDVYMEPMGGVDLVKQLLSHSPGVRVLFMSGKVTPEFTRADFAQHEFELLPKPFRSERLLSAVREALEKPARARAASGNGS